MRKRAKRSRLQQTLFNCLLILLMAGVLYIGNGLPPLTKTMLKNDVLRDNLMVEGEIIWEDTNWQNYRRMYILCDDTVVSASYRWNLLAYSRWDSDILYENDGVTCVPDGGTPGRFLVMGNLPEVSSAVLELRLHRNGYVETHRDYTLRGFCESDKVISFVVDEMHEDDEKLFDSLRKTVYPEHHYDYTLRLYDAAGQEIGMWTDAPEMTA